MVNKNQKETIRFRMLEFIALSPTPCSEKEILSNLSEFDPKLVKDVLREMS